MTESEKDQEVTRLRERCALLDSLLGECLRHRYYDDAQVSHSWLREAQKAVSTTHASTQLRQCHSNCR